MFTDRHQTPVQALIALADAVPPLYFRLKDLAEALHQKASVSAAERAVLRDLVDGSAASVPALAALRGVTRQAVQPVVDRLIARGFITEQRNPMHKRSPLLIPTPQGTQAHVDLRAVEMAALADAARNFSVRDLAQALEAIELVTKVLAENDPEA